MKYARISYTALIVLASVSIFVLSGFELTPQIYNYLGEGRWIKSFGFDNLSQMLILDNAKYISAYGMISWVSYFFYQYLSVNGIFLMKFILILSFQLLIFYLALKFWSENYKIAFLVTIIIVFSSINLFFDFSLMLSVMAVATCIYILEKHRNQQKLLFFVFPILSILLINTSVKYWWIICGVLFVYLIDGVYNFRFFGLKSEGYSKKAISIVTALFFICGIVNPYGIASISYLPKELWILYKLKLVIDKISFATFNGITMFSCMILVAMLYVLLKKRMHLRHIVIILSFLYGSMINSKISVFFISVAFLVLGTYFDYVSFAKILKQNLKLKIGISFVVSVIVISSILSANIHKYEYPQKAVEYLASINKNEKIRLFNDYNFSGYVSLQWISTLMPFEIEQGEKIFNRKENLISEYISDYIKDYERYTKKYNISHLLIKKDEYPARYLEKDSNYRLVYKDNTFMVFEHVQ